MPSDRSAIEIRIDHNLTLGGARTGAGPVMILLHGGPGCADYLGRTTFETWLAERFTVITYDQRGAGRSPSAGPFSIQHNVADLEAIRQSIGADRVTLLGHSSGAVLATHYAANYPGHVERLLLLSPAGIRPGWRNEFDNALQKRFTPEQATQIEHFNNLIRLEHDPDHRAVLYRDRFNAALPAYVDPAYRDAAPKLTDFNRQASVEVNNSLIALGRTNEWEAKLDGFDRPVDIVHGRSDPIPWSVVDEYCGLFPHANAHPLSGIGHFPWLENETALRMMLDTIFHAN